MPSIERVPRKDGKKISYGSLAGKDNRALGTIPVATVLETGMRFSCERCDLFMGRYNAGTKLTCLCGHKKMREYR